MADNKLTKIRIVIAGQHELGRDGLRDYHAARLVRDACRIKDTARRFMRIREILHPYNVVVAYHSNTLSSKDIRIHAHATGAEILL